MLLPKSDQRVLTRGNAFWLLDSFTSVSHRASKIPCYWTLWNLKTLRGTALPLEDNDTPHFSMNSAGLVCLSGDRRALVFDPDSEERIPICEIVADDNWYGVQFVDEQELLTDARNTLRRYSIPAGDVVQPIGNVEPVGARHIVDHANGSDEGSGVQISKLACLGATRTSPRQDCTGRCADRSRPNRRRPARGHISGRPQQVTVRRHGADGNIVPQPLRQPEVHHARLIHSSRYRSAEPARRAGSCPILNGMAAWLESGPCESPRCHSVPSERRLAGSPTSNPRAN